MIRFWVQYVENGWNAIRVILSKQSAVEESIEAESKIFRMILLNARI